MSARGFVGDLALGVRLAVGGGRTSWVRFALSTVGIAIAAAVLLLGASVSTMVAAKQDRTAADEPAGGTPVEGRAPVYVDRGWTEFRGESITVLYLHAAGDGHAVPPGVDDLPGPGEVLVSPALARLLDSPDGELLAPRFPGEVVGTLGTPVVPTPQTLKAYVGVGPELIGSPDVETAYAFGPTDGGSGRGLPPELLLLVAIGAVVLLLPVFIFVAATSRIAGAERDRRLAALRLVGSGSRQVRRIAAAESLVAAVAGLVLGGAVFLVGRQFAERVELFGTGVYTADVVPDPVLAVVVVLAIPTLAALTALVALRRTIIEPLGVVRRSRPVRRRLWWRVLLVAVGVALLLTGGGAVRNSDPWVTAVVAGAVLLLVGVPVLLPWLVERVAGRIEGGPTSWQLAIRRLQLDSGTSARVVGGVAVVLAGAIALQTVLMTVERQIALPEPGPAGAARIEVTADAEIVDEIEAELAAVSAVQDTHTVRFASGDLADSGPESESQFISVMDCTAVRHFTTARDCADGDVFAMSGAGAVAPGTRLEFREYPPYDPEGPSDQRENYEVTGYWTVPATSSVQPRVADTIYAELVVTPGAIDLAMLPGDRRAAVELVVDDPTSDEVEQIRNAVAAQGWRSFVYSRNTIDDLSADQAMFLTIRNSLYGGAIFTLLLAGVSLLVLALEHIRERRRPLAMLVASGVRQGLLARSLLWQVALPIALGVVVAVLTGLGLAGLIVRMTEEALTVDWLGVVLLAGGAAVLSLLVTALTLPFLRSATRLTSLRTE